MVDSIWEIIQGIYLICSLFHIFVISFGHLTAMIHIIIQRRKRPIPLLVITCILFIISVFFWHAFANLSMADLLNGNRWPADLFRVWPIFFVIDPILLILVIWFKLACSIDAFRFTPSVTEVERFRDDYEVIKGHRDFVVIYCLRGDESQDESLASIRAAVNSKFPSNRLRLLLLFYGDSFSVLDRFLRTHMSAEPLDPSLEDAPVEHLVAPNGVKISILRMGMSSSQKANLRCLDFLSMAYEEDKLRKPIVCFLSSSIVLDEMAIPRFVYELDDPHREFITGMLLQSDIPFVSSRLLCSSSFWVRIQTRIAEDYCGSISNIPSDFLVARFKALKVVASQVFTESDASDSMRNHHLSLGLMKAKSTRHRLGICLGALARSLVNPTPQPFIKRLKQRAENDMEEFMRNAEVILESHIWETAPLLGLLTIGTSIFEPHIYFFMQLFLLERASGRGSSLASSYIFLLLVPSYLFSALTGSRYGDKSAFVTILVNFLLKPLIDTVTNATICILFLKKNIWDKSKTSDASEPSTVQKVV